MLTQITQKLQENLLANKNIYFESPPKKIIFNFMAQHPFLFINKVTHNTDVKHWNLIGILSISANSYPNFLCKLKTKCLL